jgi:hypothetical protein
MRQINILGLLFCILFVLNSSAHDEELSILEGTYLGQVPPGRIPELFAPGIVSTCSQHSSAYFSSDGKEVYFSRMVPLPHVIMTMREENGRWTAPRIVCEGLTPGISPDGNTLFFSTWKLWKICRIPEGWTEPKLLPPHINFQKRQDTPYVTAEGTLYFCSMFGNADGIYRAELKNGEYMKPERIEYGINDETTSFSPYIAPDESYMIFSSTRPGYGITDLYISFHNVDGSWTKPRNMGPGINTAAKEAFPFVTFDGKYLFFMSNRVSELNDAPIPDGAGNVYWVDAEIIDDFR